MDMKDIGAAFTSMRAAIDIGKAVLAVKADKDVSLKVSEIVSRLSDAQTAFLELQNDNFKLQIENQMLLQQINSAAKWDATLADFRYVTTAGGAVVYQKQTDPQFYACPSCINGKKEIHPLQPNRTHSGKSRCTSCDKEFPINPHQRGADFATTANYRDR